LLVTRRDYVGSTPGTTEEQTKHAQASRSPSQTLQQLSGNFWTDESLAMPMSGEQPLLPHTQQHSSASDPDAKLELSSPLASVLSPRATRPYRIQCRPDNRKTQHRSTLPPAVADHNTEAGEATMVVKKHNFPTMVPHGPPRSIRLNRWRKTPANSAGARNGCRACSSDYDLCRQGGWQAHDSRYVRTRWR
jgi:hypothetical protein